VLPKLGSIMKNILNTDNSSVDCTEPTNLLRWQKEGTKKVLMQMWMSKITSKKEWKKVPEE
jgi:hypothetical protein